MTCTNVTKTAPHPADLSPMLAACSRSFPNGSRGFRGVKQLSRATSRRSAAASRLRPQQALAETRPCIRHCTRQRGRTKKETTRNSIRRVRARVPGLSPSRPNPSTSGGPWRPSPTPSTSTQQWAPHQRPPAVVLNGSLTVDGPLCRGRADASVCPSPAVVGVDTRSAIEVVVAAFAEQAIVATLPSDDVVADETQEAIIATSPSNDVRAEDSVDAFVAP